MATIDLKSFLRTNGFRHLEDQDRGATWGNGMTKVFVDRTLSNGKEPGKVRALMDQVREAARRKTAQDKADEQRLQHQIQKVSAAAERYQPRTPEQIRQDQNDAGKVAAAKPEVVPTAAAPEVAPAAPPAKKRQKFQKLQGEERVYVFGRVKAMFEARMEVAQIVAALQAEGIVMPSGKKPDANFIYQTRWSWEQAPQRKEKYASIPVPRRQGPGATKLEAPRPAVLAPPPPAAASAVARSRFQLPLSVDTVLADPTISDQERLAILFIFVELPDSAQPLIADPGFSVQQKMAVVEALGKRRAPAQ